VRSFLSLDGRPECMQIQRAPALRPCLAWLPQSSSFPRRGFWPRTSPQGSEGQGISSTLASINAAGPRLMRRQRVISSELARTIDLQGNVSLRLLGFYRDLSGAFPCLDR